MSAALDRPPLLCAAIKGYRVFMSSLITNLMGSTSSSLGPADSGYDGKPAMRPKIYKFNAPAAALQGKFVGFWRGTGGDRGPSSTGPVVR
jgi:hypothetical protein